MDLLSRNRGLHNRGVLAQFCGASGRQVTQALLETPKATGRIERHGGALKAMARKVVAQPQAVGHQHLQTVHRKCCTKNTILRHGGYCPRSKYLERPHVDNADFGSLEDLADPESRFALIHQARAQARRHLRIRGYLLEGPTRLVATYSVGDVVCGCGATKPGGLCGLQPPG